MSGINEILVPVDYSPPATAALRLAGEVAEALHAHLTVLHLLPIEVYAVGDYPIVTPDGARLEEERARLDAHVRATLGAADSSFDTIVSWGSPFLQIVDYAIERHADLIVLGTHGRTGLRHALLGSVAEKTVRLAPCPVLTVHDGAALARILGMKRTMRLPSEADVGTVMHREPIVVRPTDTLDVVSKRMVDADVRHMPVVEDGRVVGIVTDRDIQPFVGHLAHTRTNAVMTPNPTTVTRDVSIATAARRMLEAGVRALPVVDGERLIGIVSTTDMLEDYIQAARQ